MYRESEEQRICSISKTELKEMIGRKVEALRAEANAFEDALGVEPTNDGKAYLRDRRSSCREEADGFSFVAAHLKAEEIALSADELLRLRSRMYHTSTAEQEIKRRPWAETNQLKMAEMPSLGHGRLW